MQQPTFPADTPPEGYHIPSRIDAISPDVPLDIFSETPLAFSDRLV